MGIEKSLRVSEGKMVAAEAALIQGDLSKLSVDERLIYYKQVCESLALNPLTKPFGYIAFRNGELKLYALKDCTEQLRARDGISVTKIEKMDVEGCIAFVAYGSSHKNGRSDCATGVVPTKGVSGEALANAVMKAETKAKRRLTLSLCGLGMLDESEVSSIEGAKIVTPEYTPDVSPPAALPKPVVANFYLYDISMAPEEKRASLAEFFKTNKVAEVTPNVFASPKQLAKLSSILVGERNSL